MIERCTITNLMVPECSCERCLIAMVETHAPQVRPVGEVITLRPRARTHERRGVRDIHGVY